MVVWQPARSITARLALGNGALLVGLIGVVSAVFYFGTVGVLDRSIDGKIITISNRLLKAYGRRPGEELAREINRELSDGIDSDSEIFLLMSPAGNRLAGNLTQWPQNVPTGRLFDQRVMREGRPSAARLFVQAMPGGGWLYVGRDLSEQWAIRDLILHALSAAAMVSLLLVAAGAWLLACQIENRIGGIRRTTREVEAGNLEHRIAITGDDEFARLGTDINRMLDRIEHLMNGVQHVSNAIAHDLRATLARIRARLDEAISRDVSVTTLEGAGRLAIEGIDELILLFNKLLQIAVAESGMRTRSFERVDLNRVVRDMVELYDAEADARGVLLCVAGESAVWAGGDRDLLSSAVASLIDNAIKYAGTSSTVRLDTQHESTGVAIIVRDNGPGVADEELPRLAERFYRADRSRHQPGNGLGLSIVAATASLHGGRLALANACPGLEATLHLPAVDSTFPIGNSASTAP